MPKRPARPCSHPNCPGLVVKPGERYCPEHAKQLAKEYDQGRGSAARRGYNSHWRKLRKMFLAANPLCANIWGEHPSGSVVQATEVDHIIPLSKGGTNEWSNLQPLCKLCHTKKTNLLDGGGRGGQISRGVAIETGRVVWKFCVQDEELQE
ncbi:MAG: HNH endonuclease [Bacteroidales bacterium]